MCTLNRKKETRVPLSKMFEGISVNNLRLLANPFNFLTTPIPKWSISPTFYEQLLHEQIPKAQKSLMT